VKGKKSAASSDDGCSWDASPYGTLTRSTPPGGAGTGTDSANKYRANARAKLPSIFNPFVKVKLDFHGSIFLVASSRHPHRHARYGDIIARIPARMSGVSGDLPVRLATRLPNWSAGGLLRCIMLSVCPCLCVVLQIPRARHERFVADILARMSRGCYEKTASVEFKLNDVLLLYTIWNVYFTLVGKHRSLFNVNVMLSNITVLITMFTVFVIHRC